jgi:hypothetical protein
MTCINKTRLKEILLVLFPEYQSITIHKSGIITFRRTKWSRSRLTQTLDGLCYQYLPSRLSTYLKYNCPLPFVNDHNYIIEYIYQLILRRKRSYTYESEFINNELETINSLLAVHKNSHLISNRGAQQTLKLFRINNNKEQSKFKIRLRGFSLLR